MRSKVKKWMVFVLALVMCLSMLPEGRFAAKADSYGANLIVNPVFAESDVSAWETGKGSATISTATADEPIYEDVKTYGVISARGSNYDCFAQDVTAVVEAGKKYQYSFYAKLGDAYAGAPAEQRQLDFAPFVTIDGQTSYLGTYSAEIEGNGSQQLNAGEWTKFEGTFAMDYESKPEQVVLRFLEQGTEYGQGVGVMGDYYITGVVFREVKEDAADAVVQVEDIPNLKDAVTGDTDDSFIVGCAIEEMDIRDKKCFALVTKHFNAVTFGNSLKPDALFGYSNGQCPGIEEVVFNGETMKVPKLDYSRAEKLLNAILKWNQENPDSQIKVRGHVLVWHAQTPEWFFHEDYDPSKAYVGKDEMNKRLEWYIATVLGHFTGEDSPYKGMFYGWDVVNEAMGDNGKYRTDTMNPNESLTESTHGSNSSWWHVYESNEFIINAFLYANRYAPADLKLYYNDYNETLIMKVKGIVDMIAEIKATEGTRIDGMGMQAHISTSGPSVMAFSDAARAYAEAAGSVQITELDMNSSGNYDGTDETRDAEYEKHATRYKSLYNIILKLREQGVNIDGITTWGVVDKYSWLHSQSNVGGGADGKKKQCPLLFDDDYKAKPSFWAFVGEKPEDKTEETVETETVEETEAETETTQNTQDSTEEKEMEKPAKKTKTWPWIVLAGALIVAGVTAVLVNKRKKTDNK